MRLNFARKVRRVARRQYRRGLLSAENYEKIKSADSEVMAAWEKEVYSKVGMPPQKRTRLWGLDFNSIWDWFLENWPKILELLLAILPLFLTPPPAEEDV